MSRYHLFFFIFGGMGVLFFWVIATHKENKEDTPVLSRPEATYSIPRKIQYSFTLQNKKNRLLKEAEFWTYAPVKQTSTQLCERLEISHPYQLITDKFGNQILHFKFQNLPPYASKVIKIRADLTLSDSPVRVPVQDMRPFLQTEKYMESDAPEISRFAEGFKNPEPVKAAENIFHWIAGHTKYTGYLRNIRGALYALKNGQGDCTEFMALFVALARANNIPAKGIGGYVVEGDAILRPNEYHNWAEFHDDGAWEIADPQKKVFMQNPSRYIAMRVMGESSKNPMGEFSRFRFSGDGLKVKMNG